MLSKQEMEARGYTADEMNREELFGAINAEVESEDPEKERARLLKSWPEVWDIEEVRKEFEICGFAAPFCVVIRKCDWTPGYVLFQHDPRFYFGFESGPRPKW